MASISVICQFVYLISLLCYSVYGGHHYQARARGDQTTEKMTSQTANKTSQPQRTSKRPQKGDELQGLKIVCLFNNKYYYKQDFRPNMTDPHLCTHLNYEFAILDPKTHEMIMGDPELDARKNFYQEAIDLKKVNHELKVILSLGGWEDSTSKYSEMASDKAKRENFIKKAITFLKDHEFDGMNIAWEYPNCWQGAIGIHPQDKENFALLLQETKEKFKEAGLVLSVSVGAIKREIDAAYDVPLISKAVDHINVMTYDMHGPWESTTGHHAQFDNLSNDSDPLCNVKSALQIWIDKGADKKKLILGIPYYAKTFTLTDKNKFGLGAPTKGVGKPGKHTKQGGFLAYNEFCQGLKSGEWRQIEDKNAGFYAYSGDQWICYDPPKMAARKTKYVVYNGFGGVMVKDLSSDDFDGNCISSPFVMTKVIKMQMTRSVRKLKNT